MEDFKEESIWDTKEITVWKDYITTTSELSSDWIFRGQKSANYNLSTSLYRALEDSPNGIDEIAIFYIEKFLLHEFFINYSKHTDITISNTYSETNLHAYSLMSIMQHYGAPTRLQDWSKCPKIAAFFAFDGATLKEDTCVYALNTKVLKEIYWKKIDKKFNLNQDEGKEKYKNDIDFQKKINNSFDLHENNLDNSIQTIDVFEPVTSNERLKAQKGLFVVPSQPHLTISDVLEHYEIDNGYYQGQSIAKKFIFKQEKLMNLIKILTQKEKITHEVVYPGLEGLSLSLKQMIKYDNFTPKIGEIEMEIYLKNLE